MSKNLRATVDLACLLCLLELFDKYMEPGFLAKNFAPAKDLYHCETFTFRTFLKNRNWVNINCFTTSQYLRFENRDKVPVSSIGTKSNKLEKYRLLLANW